MPSARWVASSGLGLLLLATQAEAAATRSVRLVWTQNEPTCISQAALVAAVESTLGRPVFHGTTPTATIRGEVGASAAGQFEASLTMVGGDGAVLSQRTLSTEGDCRRLDESLVVVVALMIDGLEDEPAPLSVPKEPPRPPLAPPSAPPSPAAPSSWTVGIGGGGAIGLVPGLTATAALRAELRPSRLPPLGLTVRAFRAKASTIGSAGGEFSAWTAELGLCPSWGGNALRAGLCGAAGVGLLRGSADDALLERASPLRPLPFLSLLPFGAARIGGPLWVRAEVGAMFPLLRERWGVFDASGTYLVLHRASAVVPSATFFVQAQFD